WCECEACKAGWESTDKHPMLGAKLYRHSLTPVVLKFYHDIRRELDAYRPDAWVGGYVYAAYTYPPRDPVILGDRTFLVLAPRVNYGLTMYRPAYRDEFGPLVKGWREITPHLGYYAVDTWMRSILGTPLPASRPILRHMYPILKRYGVQAVLHYGLSAWGYGAVHNYLVARLLWDADTDIDAVYEEFFQRAYGKGAGPMMAIYDLLEHELARFEEAEKGFNYDMTTKIVMDVYQPNYWTIEKLYRQAHAAAETGKQRGRLETFADNLRVLHFVLSEAGLLDRPERSCFHIPPADYQAFWKRASATCYVTPQPKRDVGYITRLFVPQHRQLTIPRVPANVPVPVVDGQSNDPAWAFAASGNGLRPVGSNQPAKLATPFRVVYGDDALYLTFRCVEPNQDAIIVAGARRDDASIYTGDTFELFFGNVENRKKHWHITVNPANRQWDAWDGSAERNMPWQSAVTRDAYGWSGEIRIPFTVFNLDAPPTGKYWHVNVGREDKPSRENSTWSNVENSFIEPHNFGTWRFGEE
ncbi:MAG: DUF4838 domain-containing protein, partial [Lentisphaerae bacterium]|nr:DUF4838 domain-containing protein [Lentisphaerota bacterium]